MKPLPQEIYDKHINLVHYHAIRCISRFGAPAYFMDDLVQEGCLGLIRAWQTFDPDKGKFTTYSTPWITLYQARFVRENMSIVRPTRYNSGLSFAQVGALAKRDLSLNEPVMENSDSEIGDLIPDESELADSVLEREELRSLIREVAYSFSWSDRERIVLERRLLAWPEDKLTSREIGEMFGQGTSTARMREDRIVKRIADRLILVMGRREG